MEERMKKYRQLSPERAKVWTEKSPKYYHHYNQQKQEHQNRKVAVVYYLCRNRQLEHPHFMEVPFSSPDGLYLRDVIERLNVLRGRGMASMYSWSCKRSYKNGFVWHDLCSDDLILPAHENEYVLKGSELFEDSNSGQCSPAETVILQNQKALPEPPPRSQEESSSSSSLNGRTTKTSHDDELSPSYQHPGSSSVSPEFNVYKSDGLSDASTQTQKTCTRGVSTDDGILEHESSIFRSKQVKDSPGSTPSASSSSGRTDTLESLIRADGRKLNSFRILEKEEFQIPPNAKLKASNMIMQLISCGSVSVKDHNFGLIPTYKPRFSHSKFPSPLMGELDGMAENPHLNGMTLEDKEYFSGSFVERSVVKEGVPNLKRSSSFNGDRSEKEEGSSARTKCIPISIKTSLSKQPRCESMRSSPLSEGHRISFNGTSKCGSKRMSEPLHSENVIQIEERLASGARVIIQSNMFHDG